MIIGGDHGVVVIVHLGGEREKEILDHARVGTDTEVPVAGYDGPLTIQGGGWRLGDPGGQGGLQPGHRRYCWARAEQVWVPGAGYDGPLTIQGGGWRLRDPGGQGGLQPGHQVQLPCSGQVSRESWFPSHCHSGQKQEIKNSSHLSALLWGFMGTLTGPSSRGRAASSCLQGGSPPLAARAGWRESACCTETSCMIATRAGVPMVPGTEGAAGPGHVTVMEDTYSV